MIYAIVSALTVLGSVVGFSWVFARIYCRPARRRQSKTPGDYGLVFESVTFLSHGIPLQGWFIPIDGQSTRQACVVVAHGWSGNTGQMLPIVPSLHKAGFAVLLYDARGHGRSSGDGPITIVKFAEDIIAAVDYLETRSDVDAARLGVAGHSLGASAAIVAASSERRIRAVVSCSAFADPKRVTEDFLRCLHIPVWPFLPLITYFIERWLGVPMKDVAPKNRIGNITVPILLTHGQSDRFIAAENMAILYDNSSEVLTFQFLVAGAGHSDVIRSHGFNKQIAGFLSHSLTESISVG